MGHTRDELTSRWRDDIRWVREALLEDGQVMPLYVVYARSGQVVPVQANWKDATEKGRVRALVGLLAIALDAAAVAWMGEAWILLAPEAPDLMPSRSPRRREVVVVAIEGVAEEDGSRVGLMQLDEIVRDAGGKPSGTSEIPMPAGGGERAFDNELVDLLPPGRPGKLQRVAANVALEALGMKLPPELLGEAATPPLPGREAIAEELARMGIRILTRRPPGDSVH